MNVINIIFFDLDGTLADSRMDITDAVNRTRRTLGISGEKTLDEVHSYVGGGLRETVKRAIGGTDKNQIEKALVLFRDFYSENPVVKTSLYPGVEETLSSIPGITKAILTNKDRAIAIDVLTGLGIKNHFSEVIGGDNEKYRKPSPEGIKKILKKYGFSADSALIVGDMAIDIITGKSAGIKTCGVTYGIGKKEDVVRADPDHLINTIAELNSIIS
ncbi:MAG: HAD-IA family hydrolase [Elusimicrobiota bacterium]|nr:HAD-IA family hydrolase [Elusimicrobiota bacterium]